MNTLSALLAIACCAGSVIAAPRSSQHARVGQLATFEFDRNSAKLDRANDGAPAKDLGELAAWVTQNPDGLLVLDGHADTPGPAAYNLRLSFARAKAVREELVHLGVDPDRIVIAAFGEGGPPHSQARKVIAWGTRAGMKAVVARTRRLGPSIVSTGLLSELDLNPQPGAVARR